LSKIPIATFHYAKFILKNVELCLFQSIESQPTISTLRKPLMKDHENRKPPVRNNPEKTPPSYKPDPETVRIVDRTLEKYGDLMKTLSKR